MCSDSIDSDSKLRHKSQERPRAICQSSLKAGISAVIMYRRKVLSKEMVSRLDAVKESSNKSNIRKCNCAKQTPVKL